jgi:predicted  nucleic acid-binding Zn-ribbon protein
MTTDALSERLLAAAGTYAAVVEAHLEVYEGLVRTARSSCAELLAKIAQTKNRKERKKLQRHLDSAARDIATLEGQLTELRNSIRAQHEVLGVVRELTHSEVH